MLVGNTVLVLLVGLHVDHALYQVDNGYIEEIILRGLGEKKNLQTFPLRMMETSKGPSSADPVCPALPQLQVAIHLQFDKLVPPCPQFNVGKGAAVNQH